LNPRTSAWKTSLKQSRRESNSTSNQQTKIPTTPADQDRAVVPLVTAVRNNLALLIRLHNTCSTRLFSKPSLKAIHEAKQQSSFSSCICSVEVWTQCQGMQIQI